MNPSNKQEYIGILIENVCIVEFTKVNGIARSMTCTLRADHLPVFKKANPKPRVPNDEIISVWDVDANGWRGFRLDSVTDFKIK